MKRNLRRFWAENVSKLRLKSWKAKRKSCDHCFQDHSFSSSTRIPLFFSNISLSVSHQAEVINELPLTSTALLDWCWVFWSCWTYRKTLALLMRIDALFSLRVQFCRCREFSVGDGSHLSGLTLSGSWVAEFGFKLFSVSTHPSGSIRLSCAWFKPHGSSGWEPTFLQLVGFLCDKQSNLLVCLSLPFWCCDRWDFQMTIVKGDFHWSVCDASSLRCVDTKNATFISRSECLHRLRCVCAPCLSLHTATQALRRSSISSQFMQQFHGKKRGNWVNVN